MQEEYRFSSKKDYEDEMKRLLVLKNLGKKKRREAGIESLEDEYDKLVDEYLKFCADKDDA